MYLGLLPHQKIEWITPIQISIEYTGVPNPAYRFVVHPNAQPGAAQWMDIFGNLEKVGYIAFGGPHGRIVTGNCVDSERIDHVSAAFLVQIKETHEDSTDSGLLQPGRCIGTV
ncbi:hypothetical protein [Pseudomonas phage D6]|nr:hypothetical protein [Pseudomonas phage D6]